LLYLIAKKLSLQCIPIALLLADLYLSIFFQLIEVIGKLYAIFDWLFLDIRGLKIPRKKE